MTFSQTLPAGTRTMQQTRTESQAFEAKPYNKPSQDRAAGQPSFPSEDELIEADAQQYEHEQGPYDEGPPEDEPAGSQQKQPAPVCKCGVEAASLVSNSEKNPNRPYFKCSNFQAGCGFFQWADEAANPIQVSAGQKRPAFTEDNASDGLQLNCECGVPAVRLQARTEKNNGRWFHKCGNSGACRFFQWEDEAGVGGAGSPQRKRRMYDATPASPSGFGSSSNNAYGSRAGPADYKQSEYGSGFGSGNANSYGAGGGASGNACFKCGETGHWARDCPQKAGGGESAYGGSAGGGPFTSSNPYGAPGRSAYPSSATYGASGSSYGANSTGGGGSASGAKGDCFKCGQPGHWSRDCPGAGASKAKSFSPNKTYGGGGAGGRSGKCYKCGQEGHWSSACPVR